MDKMFGMALALGFASLLFVQPAAFAQTKLNVETSTTQKTLSDPTKLPPPPKGIRQISINSDPASTIDQPLSLMGEQLLDAVCQAQIDARKAIKLMPDLSEAHIKQACPKRLIPKTSSDFTALMIAS